MARGYSLYIYNYIYMVVHKYRGCPTIHGHSVIMKSATLALDILLGQCVLDTSVDHRHFGMTAVVSDHLVNGRTAL